MITYEITQPIWANIVDKDRIIAKLVYDNGDTATVTFPVDENNDTYKEFLKVFTHEDVDTNTDDVREKERLRGEQLKAQGDERREQEKLNRLFNAKIEAFELPIVQGATVAQKARIRKATTVFEVTALVAALYIKSGELDNE